MYVRREAAGGIAALNYAASPTDGPNLYDGAFLNARYTEMFCGGVQYMDLDSQDQTPP